MSGVPAADGSAGAGARAGAAGTADAAPARGANDLALERYRQMRRIRTFEERVGELFVRGESAGSMLHLSIGEESAAVGACAAMAGGDTFTTHHRGHGIFLARGADPDRMMAEIAGKEAGYCRGKGGSMHIADSGLGHLGANAIVGGGIPAVVGAALAAKRAGDGALSCAFFGDGATGQGVLYEAMNMAALWDLPAMFVCVNNQWGMGTRIDRATRATDLHARARAFGLAGESVDGEDVEAVEGAARALFDAARAGRPGFLAVSCYRHFGHARKDKSPYRTEAEEAEGRERDPVRRARERLVADRRDEATLAGIDAAAAAEMDAAVDFAVRAEPPALDSMFEGVYAPEEPAPEPVAARLDRVLARA